MGWRLPGDDSAPLITAEAMISGKHGGKSALRLPKTCVIFEMGAGLKHIEESYDCEVICESLPGFISDARCVKIAGIDDVCFTRGGYGAPGAADTLETVRALGVERVIIAGMCGGYGGGIRVGDALVPDRAYCEEGTSQHYYEYIEYAMPDATLHRRAARWFAGRRTTLIAPMVTSDAVYRQTWNKEAAWRAQGCVAVDMETSALLSVAAYYGMPAVAAHICSDRHPEKPGDDEWAWGSEDFRAERFKFIDEVVNFARSLEFPEKIAEIVAEKPYTVDDTGMSGARVLFFDDMVLKVEKENAAFDATVEMLRWLDGRLPAPETLCAEHGDGLQYQLMSRAPGKMLCDPDLLADVDKTVELYAGALQMLWQVDISDCPRIRSLDDDLRKARYRLENGLVDPDDCEPETFGEGGFESPQALLDWLVMNRPKEEPALSHGDFCMENVFADDGHVSCFIDLGDMGVSDKWRDIALCWRSLRHEYPENAAVADMLFERLGLQPDWEKIRYYILLDEFF